MPVEKSPAALPSDPIAKPARESVTESPAANQEVAAPLRPPRLNPRKLLLSKWTAVQPVRREKHFVVTRVIEPLPPALRIETIELEAVHSRRAQLMPWRELTDLSRWRQGWR